jgi:C1A family cysteine protease
VNLKAAAHQVPRHMAGWRHSRPDHRDLTLDATTKKLPPSASLRGLCSRIEDQGQLGSCTANATTSAMEFVYRKQGLPQPELSRLFLYYNSRVLIEHADPHEDTGCEIRDVMKAAKKYGVCLEKSDPYEVTRFSDMPTHADMQEGLAHQVKSYRAVRNLAALKRSIGLDGYPVVIGFAVPENMESRYCARTGIVTYPSSNEQIVGGHAVLAVGYDDASGLVCFQNSWGASWGDHGFGYLPYSFWEGSAPLSSDNWTIRTEEF